MNRRQLLLATALALLSPLDAQAQFGNPAGGVLWAKIPAVIVTAVLAMYPAGWKPK